MHFSLCIATIAISATFASARPLIEGVVAASDAKMEWTDLMPSSSNYANEVATGSRNYKEFEHAADQDIRQQIKQQQQQQQEEEEETEEEAEEDQDHANVKSNIDLNQEATKWIRGNDVDDDTKKAAVEHGQLDPQSAASEDASDKNSISSGTKYAFDIIMKPSAPEAQAPHRDTTLMDAGTRNAFSKNEMGSDTTDYANRGVLGTDGSMPAIVAAQNNPHDDEQVQLPPTIQVDESKEKEEEEEEQQKESTSSRFDFFDALDEALLDPYISAIDSDLNSQVYEAPVTETTTFEVGTNGDIPDYVSLIAEQIRSAEEQIRIKHDELIQDQQQIDDLKRKVHHSSPTATATSTTITSLPDPTFSMEVVESGPDEIMYVYKHISPTPSSAIQQQQEQQPHLGTSVTNSLPTTRTPDLETDQQELRAEQNVPGAVIHDNTPFYNLVQKQTDEQDYYQTNKAKKGSASASAAVGGEAVDLVIPSPTHRGDTAFDPSNKLKLPNGSWTPSCKNVSKGLYCLQPDGQGSTIIECSGENVGFQYSCGKSMLCYSTGPFDVDCQKAQDFINDE
ncbi:hypothetical protein MBANPS3_010263 [Mucor bainieri]